MKSLQRTVGRSGNIGSKLPDPYFAFKHAGIAFRRGGTSLITGKGGSYKSVIALNIVIGWARKGLRGLYFSADGDDHTVVKRVLAILTGESAAECERRMRDPEFTAVLSTLRNVRFYYEPPTIDDIDSNIVAFETMFGAFPDFIVIDNLMDCVGGGDEWGDMRQISKDLDTVARRSGAHIIVLHHTSEDGKDDGTAPPRREIQGKIIQKPVLILTVGKIGRMLSIACVKNRHGPDDPSGQTSLGFTVDPDTLRVTEHVSQPVLA